ncbi:heparin lyase I family protein [Streptomyces sp. NPDC056491]|uniref:heparin lyase I family protein n=1 Tax=Streptomyces sp. NPDC056491 TaxID=3345837 RepID=UPI0036B484D3
MNRSHARPWLSALVSAVAAVGVALAPVQTAQADPVGVQRTLDWEQSADRTLPATAPPSLNKHWATAYGATNVTAPVRDGSYAARFELRKSDPVVSNSKRAEVSQRDEQPAGVERWYGFSINLPSTWVADTSAEIVSQWHQCDSGCPGGSPPLALLTDEGRWKIDFRSEMIDLGPYTTGAWVDWVFHVTWRTDSTGLLQVWRNGERVLHRTGATHGGGPRSPYFKFGIYKWDWNTGAPSNTTERVMYYDAVRLGDERATHGDVSPQRTCTRPVTPAAASASTHEPANPPAHAVDGNLGTRWSGQGFGAALVIDTGAIRQLCGATTAWHRGDLRWNDYTVHVSPDGVSYTKAWEGRSSGTTLSPETVLFGQGSLDARYVKISFWANPENDWASITEARPLGL